MLTFHPFADVPALMCEGIIYQAGWVALATFGIKRTSPNGEVRTVDCSGHMVDVINSLIDQKVDELESYFK